MSDRQDAGSTSRGSCRLSFCRGRDDPRPPLLRLAAISSILRLQRSSCLQGTEM